MKGKNELSIVQEGIQVHHKSHHTISLDKREFNIKKRLREALSSSCRISIQLYVFFKYFDGLLFAFIHILWLAPLSVVVGENETLSVFVVRTVRGHSGCSDEPPPLLFPCQHCCSFFSFTQLSFYVRATYTFKTLFSVHLMSAYLNSVSGKAYFVNASEPSLNEEGNERSGVIPQKMCLFLTCALDFFQAPNPDLSVFRV